MGLGAPAPGCQRQFTCVTIPVLKKEARHRVGSGYRARLKGKLVFPSPLCKSQNRKVNFRFPDGYSGSSVEKKQNAHRP